MREKRKSDIARPDPIKFRPYKIPDRHPKGRPHKMES